MVEHELSTPNYGVEVVNGKKTPRQLGNSLNIPKPYALKPS